MDVKTTYETSPRAGPSLFRGGPFYRAQLAIRLINEGEWNHLRRVIIAVVITWLPLVLLTAFFNPSGLASLLTSYRVYSRFFIAVPVLLIGQTIMESRFQMVVQSILDTDLLADADLKRMDAMIVSLIRLRDSLIPEAIVIVLLIVHTIAGVKLQLDVTPWLAHGTAPDIHVTAAGWYAILVSVTIFQFLLGISLWKWLLWTIFAFRLSRLNLRLIATHPDEHGGLGFLGLVPVAFTPISFALATAIGATWRHDILAHGAKLMSFKLEAIVLLTCAVLRRPTSSGTSPRSRKRAGASDQSRIGRSQTSGPGAGREARSCKRIGGKSRFMITGPILPKHSPLTQLGSSNRRRRKRTGRLGATCRSRFPKRICCESLIIGSHSVRGSQRLPDLHVWPQIR